MIEKKMTNWTDRNFAIALLVKTFYVTLPERAHANHRGQPAAGAYDR